MERFFFLNQGIFVRIQRLIPSNEVLLVKFGDLCDHTISLKPQWYEKRLFDNIFFKISMNIFYVTF